MVALREKNAIWAPPVSHEMTHQGLAYKLSLAMFARVLLMFACSPPCKITIAGESANRAQIHLLLPSLCATIAQLFFVLSGVRDMSWWISGDTLRDQVQM
jgi:hypothetical protein